jgi:hypothetical protein
MADDGLAIDDVVVAWETAPAGDEFYVWNRTAVADYSTAANWTPTRTTPAATDRIVFNVGANASAIAFNAPTETVDQLVVSNLTNLFLSPSAANTTITVSNTATIDAGSTLNLSSINLALSNATTSFTGAGSLSAAGVSEVRFAAATPVFPTGTNTLSSFSVVDYNGDRDQTIIPRSDYANLRFSGATTARVKTLGAGDLTASGGIIIGTNNSFNLGATARTLTLTSVDSSFSGAGTLDLSGAAHIVNVSDQSVAWPGTLTPGTTSTVNLASAGAQAFDANTFANLGITGSGTKTPNGATTVNRYLFLTAGALDNTTNNVTLPTGSILRRSGGSISATPNYSGVSSVQYVTNSVAAGPEWAATLDSVSIFSSATVSSLTNPINEVTTYLNIASGSTLAGGSTPRLLSLLSATNSFTGAGNLDLSGEAHELRWAAAVPVFPSGTVNLGTTSTINYAGDQDQTIIPRTDYANITLSGALAPRIKTLGAGDLSASGTFTIGTDNTFNAGTTARVVTLSSATNSFAGAGSLDLSGAAHRLRIAAATVAFPSGTVNLGTNTATVELNGAAQTFPAITYPNLELSGSGNKTPAAAGTIVTRYLYLTAGNLDNSTNQLTMAATGIIRRNAVAGTVSTATAGPKSLQYAATMASGAEWPVAGTAIDSLTLLSGVTFTQPHTPQTINGKIRLAATSTLDFGGSTQIINLASNDSSMSGGGTLDMDGAAHRININATTPGFPATFLPGTTSIINYSRIGAVTQNVVAQTYANIQFNGTSTGQKRLLGNVIARRSVAMSRPVNLNGFDLTVGDLNANGYTSGAVVALSFTGAFGAYDGSITRFVNDFTTQDFVFPITSAAEAADGSVDRDVTLNLTNTGGRVDGSTITVSHVDVQALQALPGIGNTTFGPGLLIPPAGDPLFGSPAARVLGAANVANLVWDVNCSGCDGTITYDITLDAFNLAREASGIPIDLSGVESQLRILKRADNLSAFSVQPGFSAIAYGLPGASVTGAAGTYSITQSGLTGFSDFGLGMLNGTTLPVTWLSVAATREANGAKVTWSTASELNNERFEVQRSSTAAFTSYITVGSVAGRGTSSQVNRYSFLDADFSGVAYYRIRQVDYDGTSSLSRIVGLNEATEWAVYPNPAVSPVQITGTGLSDVTESVALTVIAPDGRVALDVVAPASSLTERLNATLGNLSSGLYVVRIGRQTIRLVKP